MVSWLDTNERPTMTDVDFLCAVLADGKPHTTNEILKASFAERGCGMTVHSRAADLRKRGINVACRSVGKVGRRNVFEYQIITGSLREPQSSAGDDGLDSHGDAGRGSQSEFAQAGAAVLPPPAAPANLESVEGHFLLDSTKAAGSLPCSSAAVPDDGVAERRPSFANQLEIWSAA